MTSWTYEASKCVVLGAVTTVTVAWLFASMPQFSGRSTWQGSIDDIPHYSQQVSSAGSSWLITDAIVPSPDLADDPALARSTLSLENELLALHYLPASASVLEHTAPTRPRVKPAADSLVIEHQHGWPLRALTCHVTKAPRQEAVFSRCAVVRRYDATNQLLRTRVLPLQPMWLGFLIDTLFYAALWFGVFFGFASAKRAIRRKRGRCPRCGYDLRRNLSAGCSECGWGRSEHPINQCQPGR